MIIKFDKYSGRPETIRDAERDFDLGRTLTMSSSPVIAVGRVSIPNGTRAYSSAAQYGTVLSDRALNDYGFMVNFAGDVASADTYSAVSTRDMFGD